MPDFTNLQITITIQDPNLDNDELQEETVNFREQIEESEIVEAAQLVTAKAPKNSKSFGGFMLGMLTAEVNPANLKKLMIFIGDRLGGKQLELNLKTPDGKELHLKASSREEFEFIFQKAQEWTINN